MSRLWQTLLQAADETVTLRWTGGRELSSKSITWEIVGKLPGEFGWYTFKLNGRKAFEPTAAEPVYEFIPEPRSLKGYLVGDRLVVDGARVHLDPQNIAKCSETVFLLEEGLDRFARIAAGRIYENGPLIFKRIDMPLGVEDDVLNALLDNRASIDHIKGVPVALDAAFRMEVWQREQAEIRRSELARLHAEEDARLRAEEERRQHEARRRELIERLGDSATRRQMVNVDFGEAARASLAVANAEYLDHRASNRRGETVVRFRVDGRRFECVCDQRLRIVDAGICLAGADRECTLESLPSVIREAIREGLLVIYRHVD